MALKRLLTEEMLHVSAAWIDPNARARKALADCPETATLLPKIQLAHQALSAAAQPIADNPRLAAISAEELCLDQRHDDIIRSTHMLLSAASTLLGNPDLLALRDQLLADGLESVNRTYRAEAGQAKQLAQRITAEMKAKLEAITVGPKTSKKTLADFVYEWVELGSSIGKLEDEKAQLQAAPGAARGRSDLVSARNQWIRVVSALVANADMAGMAPEVDAVVFGPLRASEKTADRRGARGRDQAGQAEPPATPPAANTTGVLG